MASVFLEALLRSSFSSSRDFTESAVPLRRPIGPSPECETRTAFHVLRKAGLEENLMKSLKLRAKSWRKYTIALMLVYGIANRVPLCAAEDRAVATVHNLRFFSSKNEPEEGRSMAFSPDSQELLVSTTGGTTSCIRVSDGNPIAQFNVATTGIKFSDDGRSIAMLTPKNLVLFDRATRQSRTPEVPTDGMGYVGLSLQATGGKLIVASVSPGSPTQRDGRIQVGDELLGIDSQATGRIQSVVGSSVESVTQRIVGMAGSFVALQVLKSGMPDATVIKLQRSAVRDKNGAREFIIAPKGQSEDIPVAVVRQDHVELYSTRSAKAIGTIWPKDAKSHLLVAASPDGHLVAIAGSEPQSGPIVEIHDTRTRSHVCSIPVHVSRCHAIQFTSDGHSILILDDTRVVKIDVEAQKAALAMNHEGMIEQRSNPEIYFVDGNQIVSELTLELFGGGSRWRLLRANPNSALANPYAGIRRLTSMAVNPRA